MKFIIKLITHNFPLKLVSILIAIAIWYLVVYNNDPRETQSYSVHVEVANESYIANGKQQYMIDEAYKTITVYVTGNRSALRSIDSDDISVIADLTQIVDLDRDPVVVPLSVTCKGFDATDLSLSRNTIPIVIENVASKELPVSVSTGESVVDKNYEIGALTPDPATVTISGPETIINNIDSVVASIDISGLAADRTVSGKLVFIDKNQNEISDSIIEDDITFEGGTPKVTVDVDLWKKVTDVSIEVHYSGEPFTGYQITSITTTPTELTIAGSDDALKKLEKDGNKIIIPEDWIDVSNLYTDKQFEVDISELLPADSKVSSSTKSMVQVNITVLPNGSIEYPLDVDEIRVNNLSSTLTVSYDKQEVILRITGPDSVLNSLSSDNVSVYIDLKSLSVGDYTVPMTVILPAGCTMVTEAEITVHIKEGVEKEVTTTP